MERTEELMTEYSERIQELRSARESGLIAFCRLRDSPRDEDDFWESRLSLLYFFDEDTVFLSETWGDRYCRFSNEKSWKSFLEEFLEDSEGIEHNVESSGYTAEEYLTTVHEVLLNHMSHEE